MLNSYRIRQSFAAMAAVAILATGCSRAEPSYAQALQLTPEQIQAMTPEQLRAVMLAQQQAAQPQLQQAQAPAPAQTAEKKEEGMDPLAAGLLGAAAGAAVGGLVGNSMGKTAAKADMATSASPYGAGGGSYGSRPQVVNKTVINKTIVQQAPRPTYTPAYPSQQRQVIGSVNSKPRAMPSVPSPSKSFRSSSSRRR